MKAYKKIIIFAVFIGILTVVGLGYYMNNQPSAQKAKISYSKVVVATNLIPANIKITADMVTMKSIPKESVHPEAITSIDKIIGKVSKSEIVSGEQILSSRIITDAAKATLAYRVPQNMRAVSIPNTEVTGVANHINVGDKIDILVTYGENRSISTTYTQLQNVEVAAIGTPNLAADENGNAMPASITVFVRPEQAEVLAYATLNGSFCFTLRNPIDSEKVDLEYYNSTNFKTYNER